MHKYTTYLERTKDNGWQITFDGKLIDDTYGDDLDEAVDVTLMNETLMCARIPSDMAQKFLEEGLNAQRNGDKDTYLTCEAIRKELGKAAEQIRRRVHARRVQLPEGH